MVYLSILAFVLVWWVLSKTRLGLLLKAVGESPESAHAMGYNVLAIRYGAVMFGGAMAGIGGAFYLRFIPQCGLKIWLQDVAGLQLH